MQTSYGLVPSYFVSDFFSQIEKKERGKWKVIQFGALNWNKS